MAGLHKHILDFEILPTGNTKTLVFLDESEYMSEPERPLLEVVMPGFNVYTLVNVRAKKVNTFNSNSLKITTVMDQSCLVDLPDGVWSFKYKICPYDKVYVCKKHMRVAMLNAKLSSLHNQLDLADCDVTKNKDIEKDLFQIYSLIKGSQAVVNYDSEKASSYYQLADKLVQKLLDKFCKNCG